MNRAKFIFFVLALVSAVFAQQEKQERLAIMPTMDNADSISHMDLDFLTGKLREIAGKTLPASRYGIMTQESIVDRMGSQERAEQECRDASCLADLGRRVSAAYIAQGRIGRFGGRLTIKVELYNSKSGNLVSSFTGDSKDLHGLSSVLDEKAPEMFGRLSGATGGSRSVFPSIVGGISGLERAADYELNFDKRYLVILNTEPQGAILSFDGAPIASCSKTPCRIELPESKIRIVAALEQHETMDTTVSITSNNQSINIRLKPNFGVLEIKPAYSDGIGVGKNWNLVINNKAYTSFENRFSPNTYNVKLSHECYEDISFNVGINKGSHEVFDMAKNIQLKMGGLNLSAERDGELVSESVFINGKKAGDTPFSGTVPLCAGVEIGNGKEKINVELKHNAKTTHTHRMNTSKPAAGKRYATGVVKILEGVDFQQMRVKYGKAELTLDAKRVLDGVADQLLATPNVKIEIYAHTDDQGYLEKNQELSERRAKVVVDYLATKGVKMNRMKAIGLGPMQPRASNSTAAGRAKNNRIEMRMVD